jgi:exodeoxyribonuclease VII large subunit
MAESFILTVSALNRYVKSLLESDINLKTVFVKGEISNFKAQFSSGHYYMTIKDENAQIRAAMFKYSNQHLKFIPENGMSVIVRGKVSLYEAGGEYQLIIDDMQPDGTGALAIAYEQLKKRLSEKGLFDESHKKLIPKFPNKVAVITSESGAAVRDIINVISRRFPLCEIVLCPVSVQGENAAPEIASAIKLINNLNAADVIITGRGGGSIEDLWAFNEEIVAYAVYDSKIPVISAVGHETDFTICDFVADLRAPTPSAAAELAVPDVSELLGNLYALKKNLYSTISSKFSSEKGKIDYINLSLQKHNPSVYIENLIIKFDSLSSKIQNNMNLCLEKLNNKLTQLTLKIDASSPLKIMSKGYSVVEKNGKIVSDSSKLNIGDCVDIKMNKGSVKCEVIK